jgi:hypothetical protein
MNNPVFWSVTPCFFGSRFGGSCCIHVTYVCLASGHDAEAVEQDTVALLRGLHVSCTGVFMLLADCNKVCIFRHFHKDLQ